MATPPIIDFYLLPSAAESHLPEFVCKLTEKLYRQGNKIYIHCNDKATADMANELLYSFRPESFLPHLLLTSPAAEQTFNTTSYKIVIGLTDGNTASIPTSDWVIINLTPTCVTAQRVAEIVEGEEAAKQQSREKFLQYKQQGFELRTHQM